MVEPKEPVWNVGNHSVVEPVWNLWNQCLWNYACLNPRNAWNPWNPMRLTGSTGSRNSLGSRNAKVPGQRAPQVPPVPPPSVPDFRGREMLHQAQAQRLKPNCMAVGNYEMRNVRQGLGDEGRGDNFKINGMKYGDHARSNPCLKLLLYLFFEIILKKK